MPVCVKQFFKLFNKISLLCYFYNIYKYIWDKNMALNNSNWDNTAISSHWAASRSNDLYSKLFATPIFYKAIGNVKDKTILDIGCGNGDDVIYFSKVARKIYGIDASLDLISKAKENCKTIPNIELDHALASDLRIFLDDYFDMVISKNVFMHLSNFELNKCYNEIKRILKTDGLFVFLVKHPFEYRQHEGFDIQNNHYTGLNQSYFDRRPFEHTITIKGADKSSEISFQITVYPKTLEDYLVPLIQKGFKLVDLKEPTVPKKLTTLIPYYKRFTAVPSLLLMSFQKQKI